MWGTSLPFWLQKKRGAEKNRDHVVRRPPRVLFGVLVFVLLVVELGGSWERPVECLYHRHAGGSRFCALPAGKVAPEGVAY